MSPGSARAARPPAGPRVVRSASRPSCGPARLCARAAAAAAAGGEAEGRRLLRRLRGLGLGRGRRRSGDPAPGCVVGAWAWGRRRRSSGSREEARGRSGRLAPLPPLLRGLGPPSTERPAGGAAALWTPTPRALSDSDVWTDRRGLRRRAPRPAAGHERGDPAGDAARWWILDFPVLVLLLPQEAILSLGVSESTSLFLRTPAVVGGYLI